MSLGKFISGIAKNLIALKSEKIKLATDKLKSGEEVEYLGEAIEVGLPIDIKHEDGTSTVLPDGEYETEAGIKFIVTDGVVSEIVSGEPAEEVAAETAENVAEEVIVEVAPEILGAIQEAIAKAIEPLEAELKKFKASASEANSNLAKLSKIVGVLADAPGAEGGAAVGFSKKPKETKAAGKSGALSAFAEERNK